MASLKTSQHCGHAWAWHVEGACQKCRIDAAEKRIEELERDLAEMTKIAMNYSEAHIKVIAYMAETVPGFKEALGADVPDWEQRLDEARRLNKMARKG